MTSLNSHYSTRVRVALTLGAALLAGGIAGTYTESSRASQVAQRETRPIASVPISSTVSRHAPSPGCGAESPLHVELTPVAVNALPQGDSLEFEIDLTSRFARPVTTQYVYQVTDDHGRKLQPARYSNKVQLSKTGDVHTGSIMTPAGVPNGYFQVRVTAAASDGRDGTVQVVERYFFAQGSNVSEVSPDEWFAKSAATLAR